MPKVGRWREILNTDAMDYGGSGIGNMGGAEATETPYHGHPASLEVTLPPLATVYFEWTST